MNKTWVIVSDGLQAQFYRFTPDHEAHTGLELVKLQDFVNAELATFKNNQVVREKKSNPIKSDKVDNSAYQRSNTKADDYQDYIQTTEHIFAKAVSHDVVRALNAEPHAGARLVLIAGDKMVGQFRQTLSKQGLPKDMMLIEVHKNLVKLSPLEIHRILAEENIVAPPHPVRRTPARGQSTREQEDYRRIS